MSRHGLFKPKSFEEGAHAVVGSCNGYSMEDRFRLETPLFAKAILRQADGLGNPIILDYGCGVGRLAKEILSQCPNASVVGVDDSAEMREKAVKYVNHKRFEALAPEELDDGIRVFDLAYCVYVLQHVPAIEIREILGRIRRSLEGAFCYCSSDYRMAVRFDNAGFFDDRFLGVELRDEVQKLFGIPKRELFTDKEYAANQILRDMVKGEGGKLAHPALVYSTVEESTEDAVVEEKVSLPEAIAGVSDAILSGPQKILMLHRLSPGDILVMTAAIRDLHLVHPGKYLTDVRSPCPEIFENNPHITKLTYDEKDYEVARGKAEKQPGIQIQMGDILVIDMHYPLIHRSGKIGAHFIEGYHEYLSEVLGVKIPVTDIYPELFLNQNEQLWPSPVVSKTGTTGKYWVINAGNKGDYELKQYHRYQEVVDLLKGIQLVQIGHIGHGHPPLLNVVDMRGKTDLRELFRVIYHAEGVITCVSLPMHIAAAFHKPCVVISGAREGTRWELYPNQQFIYRNGCLPCSRQPGHGDGCWRSKFKDCDYRKDDVPVCMSLITPEEIVKAVNDYYAGGMLVREEMAVAQ